MPAALHGQATLCRPPCGWVLGVFEFLANLGSLQGCVPSRNTAEGSLHPSKPKPGLLGAPGCATRAFCATWIRFVLCVNAFVFLQGREGLDCFSRFPLGPA